MPNGDLVSFNIVAIKAIQTLNIRITIHKFQQEVKKI
jgi:hypothetical protein